MARLPLSSKLIKHRNSPLLIRVRKAQSFDISPFHSRSSCAASSNKIYLKFIKHIQKRYVDPSSACLIGEVIKLTKDITVSLDRHEIFKLDHLEQVLESLEIKKDSHDKIIAEVMLWGNKMNKMKDFKGLVVNLTVVRTFLGDQASIHRALEESDPEKAEIKADECILVTSELAVV